MGWIVAAGVLAAFIIGIVCGYRLARIGVRSAWPAVAALLVVGPSLAAPPDAVAAALADCRTLAPETAKYTRYFDLTHLPPAERTAAAQTLSFWLNSLSRESDIVPPRAVAGGALLAFDLRDYSIDLKVYGRFATVEAKEPYFHVVVEKEETYTPNQQSGYPYQPPQKRKTRETASAPWLPAAETAELIQKCWSQAPIIRGDWFFYQTAIQANRVAGYYDFLGLGKKEADFQKLGGVNVAEAKRLKLEMAASVAASGVTINNRGITRMQALTGPLWFTQDYKTSVDKQNTARLLNGDTEPPQGDATEQYLALPNKLFAFGLFNDKGERQDSAPDFIASDSKSTSNDRRVHAGLSCVRCHAEGLRPIDDYARKLFRGPLQLKSPDYERFKRLRQLYGSDLPGQLAADNAAFAAAVRACNGLDVGTNAKQVAAFWEAYADTPVTVGRAAAELGCQEEKLIAAVQLYARGQQVFDPVMAAFAQTPPLPVRREHWEETFAQFQKLIGGVP